MIGSTKWTRKGLGIMETKVAAVMAELEKLGTERLKKNYIGQGAHEPLFGVATGAMKPLAKQHRGDQPLAEALYATGNYDAMYFAGVIADVGAMTEANFDRWMETAYFHMISDYVVAVSLAEADFAQAVADRWIKSGRELYVSAGYSCYCWLLGNRKDEEFDPAKLREMLDTVRETIHDQPDRVKYSMNTFVMTVGLSYRPLHAEALAAAEAIGTVEVTRGKTRCNVPLAAEEIRKAEEKGRIGFKRKNVRC